tara:strand:- start:785 stop:958 length:174 start_codon:yes stop_codon:yes gene_type:complete
MPHGIQNSAQSHQSFTSITVIGESVKVVTDKSTKIYPCGDVVRAEYYARHLAKHFTN